MSEDIIIDVKNITKMYKLYEKQSDRLKESLSLTRKKYHREFYALSDISFCVKKGDSLGIIGENGAGKSTLLKILTGVTTPTSGTMVINGKVSALLELGAGFNPEYTGKENVFLNGTIMGYTKEEMQEKYESIVNFADIGDFIYQPVKSYSSGMFARLAFAVAINVEPDILIVDEALSVGDMFFQHKCFRKMEELKEKGATILFVSHDLASVKEMCTKAVWLEKGTLKMFGENLEVCNEYSNNLLRQKNDFHDSFGTDDVATENYEVKTSIDLTKEQFPEIIYTNDSIVSDEARIISCFIKNSKNEITNVIHAGENCVLSVVFETKVDIKKCIVGFAMATLKGTWVINPNTLIVDEMKSFEIKKDTITKVDFVFKMPLFIADNYIIEAALNDGIMSNYKTLTWLYNILNIRIVNEGHHYALIDVDTKIKINSCEK